MRYVAYDAPIDFRKARDSYAERYSPDIHPDTFNYVDGERYVLFEEADLRRIDAAVRAVNRVFVKEYAFTMERFAERMPKFAALEGFFPKTFEVSKYFIGGYDVLVEKGTMELKFLETNANTPGFINEPYGVSKIFCPEGRGWCGAAIREHVRKTFAPYAGKKLGILLSHSFSDEDYMIACDYRDMLEGIFPKEDVIIADIFESNLVDDRAFVMKGEEVGAVLNFFPLEFFLEDPDFAVPFFDLVAKGAFVLKNGIESMVLQDKGVFAAIWEDFDRFDPEEREAIERHVPYTTYRMPEKADGWVAKWRLGRMGREIYLDSFESNIDRESDFVFQKRVESHETDPDGRSFVLRVFNDFSGPIAYAVRRQVAKTTDDDDSDVPLSFHEKPDTLPFAF